MILTHGLGRDLDNLPSSVTLGLGRWPGLFLQYELWIQIEGAEPVPALAGLAAGPVAGAEPGSALGTLEPLRVVSGRAPSRSLNAAGAGLQLQGREPGLSSTSSPRLRPSGSEPLTAASGEEPGPVEGAEYDTEQSGKERGWPKS